MNLQIQLIQNLKYENVLIKKYIYTYLLTRFSSEQQLKITVNSKLK